MYTTKVNATTQKAAAIIADLHRAGYRDIFDAYGRPSSAKINSWKEIERRAKSTAGYNNDLHITGAGSNFYSTVYSYTDDAGTHVIKDTFANTYEVII